MKNLILVIGGAGFVGSNLIKHLIKNSKYKVLSYDNYSTGLSSNHFKNSRVQYINADSKNISKVLKNKKKNIKAIFHFGEFARIYQSFIKLDECFDSNVIGTHEVFKFCLKNKIKLIYSATSATLGNYGNDKNLSPYAFTKSKNLELLENYKRWFGFKFEVIYFYNVYGPMQISKGQMATVIGIFEECYKQNAFLPVVRPGNQSRNFTHIDDTIKVCLEALSKNNCQHYSISNKKSYTILQVAKMFSAKIKLYPERPGERYKSSIINKNLNNKIINRFGKIDLKQYVKSFKNSLIAKKD
jgi:UDP-glucose 4-epimerase